MTRKIVPIIATSTFILGVILGGFVFRRLNNEVEIEATFKVNDLSDIEFMVYQIGRIVTVGKDGPVEYKTVRKYFDGKGFTMKQSVPLKIPDHHGSAELHLIKVSDGKALIGYQWVFSHVSFGKNLETISSGVVEIDVVPNDETHNKSGLEQPATPTPSP